MITCDLCGNRMKDDILIPSALFMYTPIEEICTECADIVATWYEEIFRKHKTEARKEVLNLIADKYPDAELTEGVIPVSTDGGGKSFPRRQQ